MTLKIHEVSDFSDSQFLEKIQNSFTNWQNASQITNCNAMANSNPAML